MPEIEKEEFKFPDENSQESESKPQEELNVKIEAQTDEVLEVEIEDDTPPEDRNRQPLPQNLKEELEKDELDIYDDKVKEKLKQMKRVWHDERRAKEEAFREQQEAVVLAQRLMEENKRIKNVLDTGGKEYAAILKNAAQLEMEVAKRAYKEAYDSGDTDQIVEAQNALQLANYKMMQAQNFKMPPLQEENFNVQNQEDQSQTAPAPANPRLKTWLSRNPWYGADDEMTATMLGVDAKLKREGRVQIGSDEYYAILDKTIRKRYPEYFESESTEDIEVSKAKAEPARTKPSTVVAPAVRSTSSNKIKLRQSQVNLSKKLGITPEQYALELKRLEAQNG
jgi:hypothetical protein